MTCRPNGWEGRTHVVLVWQHWPRDTDCLPDISTYALTQCLQDSNQNTAYNPQAHCSTKCQRNPNRVSSLTNKWNNWCHQSASV